tara:strand:+ start:187 stop:639 length:453 start_codon:yes stop_codon:yes gene_type:complete
MIDPISAFALVKTAHSSLMHGIKMGRDFASMGSSIAKLAKGEAALSVAKEKKKKSLFGNVVGNAIDKHFQEEERERLYSELRSMVQLYGSAGQWERLAATIQAAKVEHRKQLQEQAKIDYRNKLITSVSAVILIGLAAIYYFAMYLKGEF